MKEKLVRNLTEIFQACEGNRLVMQADGPADGRELVIFEKPEIGFADAADPIFDHFKDPEVIGPFYRTPREWLPEARTVISLFLPFTEQVRKSNLADREYPSTEWLYGRIEGQAFITRLMAQIAAWLDSQGIRNCVPSSDPRFGVIRDEVKEGDVVTDFHAESRWSERHAAYACGLGTFGLSRGLISRAGIAGRYASVIVDAQAEPDPRPYTGVYDYCTRCGACVRRCPVQAISLRDGKNNQKCSDYVNRMGEKYAPRYGCGKCQTGVPCEHGIPLKRA